MTDEYYDNKVYVDAAIMASTSRMDLGQDLMLRLADMPHSDFVNVQVVDDKGNGEWWCGVESWLSVANSEKSDWSLVIQDDAIVGNHFYDNLQGLLQHAPNAPISLYTGTIRPKQKEVRNALRIAEAGDIDFLVNDDLLWGVAVLIPTWMVCSMINEVNCDEYGNLLYDRRLGAYFKNHHIPVFYTWPSLVDHNFTMPSETGHDKGPEARRAVRFEPGLVDKWHWDKAACINSGDIITCADY